MITITSADGTAIAVDRTGSGPALVLVAGALTARSAFEPIATLLSADFTVYGYDRRGRGDSGDSPPYAVDREIEDLAAVVELAGGPAFVFGHSSGAVLALEAAAAGVRAAKLALYEPPFMIAGSAMPPSFADDLAGLVAAGRRGDALVLWMRSTVGMSEEAIVAARTEPWWAAVEALVHTTPYDATITAPYLRGRPLPTDRWSDVTVPTLVLDGEVSPPFLREAAAALATILPNASTATFPGQGHGAPPELLAPVLRRFFLDE